MNRKWLFALPDLNEWAEIKPLDYFFNQKTGRIDFCQLGAAPENLVLGLAIQHRHRKNRNLILNEFRQISGEKPFYMEWREDGKEDVGAARKDSLGNWQVRSPEEKTVWEIEANEQTGKKKVLGIIFKNRKTARKNVSASSNSDWRLRLPADFPKNFPEDWIIVEECEFGMYPDKGINVFRSGQSPKHLVMGKVIIYQSRKNAEVFLRAYHRFNEDAPFLIKWAINDPYDFDDFGSAMKKPDGSWRIKQLNEKVVWDFSSNSRIFPYRADFEGPLPFRENSGDPNLN